MGKTAMKGFLMASAAALALTLAAGAAQAATRVVLMDAFKPVFQFAPGGEVARYYPAAIGGRTPAVQPVRNYSACTVLKFPARTKLTQITYMSVGDSGWSYAFIDEYGYGSVGNLQNHYVAAYPTAEDEKTLLADTDSPIVIRSGYRYELCVEGAPGADPYDYNQFLGFKIRYTAP